MRHQRGVSIGHFIALLAGIFLLTVIASEKVSGGIDIREKTDTGDETGTEETLSLPTLVAENCRYGVAAWSNQHDWFDDLGVGWYLDFTASNPTDAPATEYLPMIRIKQDKDPSDIRLDSYTVKPPLTDTYDGLGWLVEQRPGAIWIIGNEFDRGPDPGKTWIAQDDTMPDVFADAYHEVTEFIKSRDEKALVAIGGMVEVTPGRLQYLDLFWQAYYDAYGTAPTVDIWTMHLYILPEVEPNGTANGIANVALGTDPALGIRSSDNNAANCPLDSVYCTAEADSISAFNEQIVAMRAWMRDKGQQQKPLLLSEYSILYPYKWEDGTIFTDEFGKAFDPQRVSEFMVDAFNYLEGAADSSLGFSADNDRLIQQWLWYSVETNSVGNASNLVEDGSLTLIGQTFQNWVTAQSTSINLQPDPLAPVAALIPAGHSTTTATLSLAVRNNGTVRVGDPFTITFNYMDGVTIQNIGSVVIPAPGPDFPGMTGCATRHISVEVDWTDLGPGRHEYWVEVDSGSDIPEDGPGESDNIAEGFVLIDGNRLVLPLVLKE